MQTGTIIFDVEEISTDFIIEENWEKFDAGKQWGWPGGWASTKEAAQKYLTSNFIKAYEISSSLGLNGWVLAKHIQIYHK